METKDADGATHKQVTSEMGRVRSAGGALALQSHGGAQAKKDGENINGERWSESWGEHIAPDGTPLEKWTSKHAVDAAGKEPLKRNRFDRTLHVACAVGACGERGAARGCSCFNRRDAMPSETRPPASQWRTRRMKSPHSLRRQQAWHKLGRPCP